MWLWALMAIIALLTATTVAWPLLSPRRAPAASDEERRLSVFRERRREIERERRAGRLGDAEAEQAQHELIEAVAESFVPAAEPRPARPPTRARPLALAIIVFVPALAIGLYLQLGSPWLAAPGGSPTRMADAKQSELQAIIAEIERRTREHPDSGEAWAVLARTRALQGRHVEAVAAFERAFALLPPDASLLTDFAESTVRAAGGGFGERTIKLLEQALALQPDQLKATALMGVARYRQGEFSLAREHLRRVQAALPPGSNDAMHIETMLAGIDARLAEEPGAAGEQGLATTSPDSRSGARVDGRIEIDPELAASIPAGATLFVVARAASDPRVPVAVLRIATPELPYRFSLGDADAMDPSRLPSTVGPLLIEARLSRSGQANRQAGDLIGQASASVRAGDPGTHIVIDRLVSG
jgi:cytochrome c-type biogenesis protein CcmH